MRPCSRVVGLLLDYLEGRLAPAISGDLERHLSDCPSCVAYVRTYRSTISLLRSLGDEDLPPELQTRLKAFIDSRSRQ